MCAFVRTILLFVMVGMKKNEWNNDTVHVIFKRHSVDVKREPLRDRPDLVVF
jgi:hypothetical protein